MTKQTIKFSNGTVLPIISVWSSDKIIQNAYRTCFEIWFPYDEVSMDTLSSIAVPENLSELILTETNDETDEVVEQYSHFNFTIVTGMGMKTVPENGTKVFFLCVAQKSDTELSLEQLKQDNEDIQTALMELAEIVSEV